MGTKVDSEGLRVYADFNGLSVRFSAYPTATALPTKKDDRSY
jgi:hypothetical protein